MSALEQALIARFETLGRVPAPFLLGSDQRVDLHLSALYAPRAQLWPQPRVHHAHCPQQNGMSERAIRTLKEQCVHRDRFEAQQHVSRVIGEWIRFYNTRRPHPHQALGMKTPAMTYALAA
jgi:putative transposase